MEGMTPAQLAARKPISSIIDPPNGKIPYQPWAQKRYEEILSRYNGEHVTGEPQTARDVSPMLLCIYSGAPFRWLGSAACSLCRFLGTSFCRQKARTNFV